MTHKKYDGVQGIIYLLHFSEPYKHAKHYLGWTADLPARLAEHRAGRGAKLTRAAVAAGIGLTVVRTWAGDTFYERRLHRQRRNTWLCPVCTPPREAA